VVPRRRHPAADAVVGQHDPGGHTAVHGRVVDLADSGARDPGDGRLLQPRGRGAQVDARPRRERRGAAMTAYAVRRGLWSLLVLVSVSAVTFTIFFAVPGNPAELIAGKYGTPQTIALIEKRLGLDQPKPVQFVRFLTHAARGDWGYSYVSQQPVLGTIL